MKINGTVKKEWIKYLLVSFLALAPTPGFAAGLAPRSIQVGSSAQSASTDYTIDATTATTASIGSILFQFCTTATGACVTPTGLVTTAASLTAANPVGFNTINASSNGAPYIIESPTVINSGTAMSFTLSGITNPSTANQTYNVRITTFNGIDGATGPVDTGNVALSTAQPIQLTGVTPEILVFCVGTSITSNCTTIAGSTIDFGDFSPTATNIGTSVMQAQTNASSGYSITVNGTTLSSGVNTIPAMASQAASVIGNSQFGLNLRANTVPAVGADPTGAGIGTYTANYGAANQYRFGSGDAVASAAGPTNANTFTSSYIVNIGGAQAAGVYTATTTYICTASF